MSEVQGIENRHAPRPPFPLGQDRIGPPFFKVPVGTELGLLLQARVRRDLIVQWRGTRRRLDVKRCWVFRAGAYPIGA